MNKLKFYEAGHRYEVDGRTIPSVSEIIRFISREAYGDVNKYILDNAAERGTAVHKAAETLDRTGIAEIETQYASYLKAYIKFLRENDVKWLQIETAMYCAKEEYAGTIDRLGYLNGDLTLLDIKTNAAIKKILVKAQLNGYEFMRRSNGKEPCKSLKCLQLKPDGSYRLYGCAVDNTEFLACLALHRAMMRKQERMKIK